MRKVVLVLLGGLALAACDSPVPNSAAGVGFGDYETYLRQREAELRGQQAAQAAAAPAPAAPAAAPGAYGASGYGATPVTSSAGLAAASVPAEGTIGADALAALRATAPVGAEAGATDAAVGAPLDAMVPAPAPVPTGSTGPNLAAYALAATNAPGQQVYQRGGLHLISASKACSKYISPDLAQMAFLKKGGPQKDSLNLDPDGDGFACGWDPRPFQTARP